MVDFDYLYKGLCGLANAHKASSMAGHLGAALVAGYFFSEDQPQLPSAVHTGVERELDRVLNGGETFWWNRNKTGITTDELFEALPQEEAQQNSVRGIVDALSRNIGQTRQSGHNVIFAATAIRALHDHPEFATPSITGGIQRLVRQFDGAVPGRGYYGSDKGWISGQNVKLSGADDTVPYRDEQHLAEVMVDELIATASMRRQGFGGLWHLINHAAGLTELSRFGYRDLARKGFAAHRHHLRLWRSLPDVESELGSVVKAAHDPRTAEYWSDDLKRDEADRRDQAEDRFLYLMA
ncbi:MAG: hypothetical protein ACYTGL_03980 [Planctomycetota bacterium]|jgi:hypothetical protein